MTPSDRQLRASLLSVLTGAGLEEPREIVRQPSRYETSFPLEELHLTFEGGSRLKLGFKQLGWSTLGKEARLAKPDFLHDPRREPAVYSSLLAGSDLGAPRHYGSVEEPEHDRYWIFIEWVDGRELYQVGERALWETAARWLARAHMNLGQDLERRTEVGRLLVYDASYYWRWIERAREFAAAPNGLAGASRFLGWLADRYGEVVEELLEMPRTVLHGEFYASNVLVAGDPSALRVAPVDWELAANGPGLVDLAALVSGDWSDSEQTAVVDAYRSVQGVPQFTVRELDLARLHLAVQWLGWAPASWQPPEGQRHDWLAEALQTAERLEL